MKKFNLIISGMMAIASLSASAQHSIYVANRTGWEEVSMYAYGLDGEGQADPAAEIFGAWPGAAPAGTETINGVVYSKFTTTAADNGKTVNLIYNNGSSQLNDLAGVVLDKDYYFAADPAQIYAVDPSRPIEEQTPSLGKHTLFVDNQSGAPEVNVYAWATGQPELFGGWPGASSNGTEVIEGTTYLTYEMKATDVSYNLIFSFKDVIGQFDGPTVTPASDIFIKITATSAEVIADPRSEMYKLYVKDDTGWNVLNIYAWGASEYFGGWPGKPADSTETVDNVEYKVWNIEGNGLDYNLIFNNGTDQFDGPSLTFNKDYFLTASDPAGIGSVSADAVSDAPVYFDLTGRRVDSPVRGLYIKVCGSETSKIIL